MLHFLTCTTQNYSSVCQQSFKSLRVLKTLSLLVGFTLRLRVGFTPPGLKQDTGVRAQSLLSHSQESIPWRKTTSPLLLQQLSPAIPLSITHRRAFRGNHPLSLSGSPVWSWHQVWQPQLLCSVLGLGSGLFLPVRGEPSAARRCQGRVNSPWMCLAEPGRAIPRPGGKGADSQGWRILAQPGAQPALPTARLLPGDLVGSGQ